MTTSADELGELARNTEKLLKAVAEYTNYLQKLAGRLSHELKTPIAITRSSLENLASQDELQALMSEIKSFEAQENTMITLPGIYQVSGYRME